MAKRIQRKRTKGWRMPEGAVYVGRPTKWGNPFLISDAARSFPSLTMEQCHAFVVNQFRDLLRSASLRERIRAELAGRDLACWCALEAPCHADVLLEVAGDAEEDQER